MQTKIKSFFYSIKSFNLFSSYPPSTDEYELKTERITTFVYIISLVACLLCLVIYTANENITQTITIKTPSLEEYRSLYKKQGDNLTCSCSSFTSQYKDFTIIEPKFHQFCSSDFVQNNWLTYTYTPTASTYILDFRISASLSFHGLASYCSISNRTISNEMTVYQSTQIITTELLSEKIFIEKVNQNILSFITETNQVFFKNLETIRQATYGNQLLTREYSNSMIIFRTSSSSFSTTVYPNLDYPNCNCVISSKCILNSTFYTMNGSALSLTFSVPGLHIGCYTSEALLKSTLECFYNQTCIDTLKFYLNYTTNFNVTALDRTIPSQFNEYALIGDLLNDTMVDEWKSNISYSNYFTKCQPSSCIYKIISKTPWIVVITTLIGLFGGLAKILQIIVPIIITIVRYRRNVTETEDLCKFSK